MSPAVSTEATELIVAALQLEATPASSLAIARAALLPALRLAHQRGARLAVLPAYLGLSLVPAFVRPAPATWDALAEAMPALAASLGPAWAALSAELARESRLLLLTGTTIVVDSDGQMRHRAFLFGPDGAPLGWQDQTHPGARERLLGVIPSNTLEPIETPYGRVGIIIGDDVLVPEVGAILALQGARIVLHPTAIRGFSGPEWQRRLWREIQAHQVFGVEAPIIGMLFGERFSGLATIHAPIEITHSEADRPHGVLAQAADPREEAVALAALDERRRQELLGRYNISALRNTTFCSTSLRW